MTTQVTLIALYGDKGQDFAAAISECRDLVSKTFGTAFAPYDIDQIHATIVGLERHRGPAYNANFSRHRRRDAVVMDFDGFLAYLRGCGHIPFDVQLGGFDDRTYPFTSRETTPYERSFSVQGDKVVLMGWPVRGEPLTASAVTAVTPIQEARWT